MELLGMQLHVAERYLVKQWLWAPVWTSLHERATAVQQGSAYVLHRPLPNAACHGLSPACPLSPPAPSWATTCSLSCTPTAHEVHHARGGYVCRCLYGKLYRK